MKNQATSIYILFTSICVLFVLGMIYMSSNIRQQTEDRFKDSISNIDMPLQQSAFTAADTARLKAFFESHQPQQEGYTAAHEPIDAIWIPHVTYGYVVILDRHHLRLQNRDSIVIVDNPNTWLYENFRHQTSFTNNQNQ